MLQVNDEIMDVLSKNIKEGNKRICEQLDKTILIMGKTQSGKSTLMYILNNKELKAEFNEDEGRWQLKYTEQLGTVEIGSQGQSQTEIPNKVYNETHQVTIWDCPGSYDTKGQTPEISNSFYIYRILTTSDQIKLIMVCAEEAIKGTCQAFIESLIQFVMTFQDISLLENSVSLVVTQCSIYPQKITIEQILTRLQKTVRNNIENGSYESDQKKKCKQMLGYFENKRNIYLIHTPDYGQEIFKYDQQLLQNIQQNTTYVRCPPQNANVSLNSNALDYAEKLFDLSNQYLIDSLQKVAKLIIEESKLINADENIIKQQPQRSFYSTFYEIGNKVKDLLQIQDEKKRKPKENIAHKKLLNNQDIVKFHQIIKIIREENQQSLEQLCKCIDEMFKLLILRTIDQDKKAEHEDQRQEIHEKINYVLFLEKVCKNKKMDISSIQGLFEKAAEELNIATAQGILNIEISPGENDEYYDIQIQLLEKYLNNKTDLNLSLCAYHKGVFFQENKNYNEAMIQYKIALNKNKTADSINEIYEKITQIYFVSKESLEVIVQNQQVLQKLFDLNIQRLNNNYQQIEQFAISRQKDDTQNFLNYQKQKDYAIILQIDDIIYILKELLQINTGTFNQNLFIKNIQNVLNIMKQDAKDAFQEQLLNLQKEFSDNMKSVIYFLELLNKKELYQEWMKFINTLYEQFQENLISRIEAIEKKVIKDENYYNNVINISSLLQNSEKSQIIISDSFYQLGILQICKSDNASLEKAVKNFNESLKYDKSNKNAIQELAKILFRQKKYSEAMKQYMKIQHFSQILQSFNKAVEVEEDNDNLYKLNKEMGSYYAANGLEELAICKYREAMSCKYGNEETDNECLELIQIAITSKKENNYSEVLQKYKNQQDTVKFYPQREKLNGKANLDTEKITSYCKLKK